jgi:hypothetical protein
MRRMVFIMAAMAVTAGSAWAWGGTGTTSGTSTLGTTNTMRGIETRIEDASAQVGAEATRVGDATFTERFATEFGVTTGVLAQQQTQFQADWGDLFIAYSIQDASRTSVTLDQIFTMRASGEPWTQIAMSLRVPPGRLLHSVQTRLQTFDTAMAGTSARRSGSRSGGSNRMTTTGINRQIDTQLRTLDDQMTRLDDTQIADRLAQDFGVTADVLTQQRTQFNADWGDIVLAYTIMDRSKTTVTIDEIFALRSSGESWTQVAREFRVSPGRLLGGIRAEARTLATADTETTTSGRLTGKAGTARVRLHTKGPATTASMKTARGSSATRTTTGSTVSACTKTTLSTGTAARISSTRTSALMGRGAMMRAAARAGHK